MCLGNGLARPGLPSRLEAAFRFAVVTELALQRRLSAFLGGPFRGIKPIRSFDEFAVSADGPIKDPRRKRRGISDESQLAVFA